MPFTKLGLNDQLVQGILATGYSTPTPIQAQAIPLAVAGRDIIGCAQTGTGKTAAFMLPMINLFLNHPSNKGHLTRGLVLTPTRELAQQIDEFAEAYGRFTNLQCASIFGGVNMSNQIKRLQRGVDIVVATPGRLLDHINRRTVNLSHVEFLVIDEADRMFDMGFIQDVKKIISYVPAKRQTLLFSATMSPEVRALVGSIQQNPEQIQIGERRKPVETVRQKFYSVPQDAKIDLLLHIFRTQELDCVLIFSRTKHGADRISTKLERSGIKSVAIHSNRTQSQRQHALSGFKQGQYKVMVATDIAARGIDVEGISHVINYDTPAFAEDYIHRIGRTGRASATGDAITFVGNDERNYFKKIERYTEKNFDLAPYPGFERPKKAPATEHSAEGTSSQEQRGERRYDRPRPHGGPRRDEGSREHSRGNFRRDNRPQGFSERKPQHDGERRDDKPRGSSERRPQRNDERRTDKPRGFSERRPQRNDERRDRPYGKPHNNNERRERPQGGVSRYGERIDTHNQSARGTEYPRKRSTFVDPSKAKTPAPETDWRSLVDSMSEERGGGKLKKKLKRLFTRDKE
jgi:ATP-dependent RNA helicase RhlE